jgi:hypothetical protein
MNGPVGLTYTVYIGASIAFLVIVIAVIVYNVRLKARKATEARMGREPVSTEEGIAIATEAKDHDTRASDS